MTTLNTHVLRSLRFTLSAAIACMAWFANPAAAQGAGPGFDCRKATQQIERAICSWDTVAAVDRQMADAYKAAVAAQSDAASLATVQADQRRWLGERNRRCALNTVTPDPSSEEGLSPKQQGQLMCLQEIYPPRIAQLKDIAEPSLVPEAVTAMPTDALRAAYPEDWQRFGYDAQYSPDGTLLLLLISEINSANTDQLWLYRLADHRLVAASPLTHRGQAGQPGDISEFNAWRWGGDGKLYIRARRPRGTDGIFASNIDGYSEVIAAPADIREKFAAHDAASLAARQSVGSGEERHNEQSNGRFTLWAEHRGHGAIELKMSQANEPARVLLKGGWELQDFVLDEPRARIFYGNGDGLAMTELATLKTRRVRGTRGGATEIKPLTVSSDGSVLVYAANGPCVRDAAAESKEEAKPDTTARVCLAQLPAAPVAAEAPAVPATPADAWSGRWTGSGAGVLTATIRRGTAKPEFLVVDVVTGMPGCSGAVTVFGKPEGQRLRAKSYDAKQPKAPVCTIDFELSAPRTLRTESAGDCTHYHGGSCDFSGTMTPE